MVQVAQLKAAAKEAATNDFSTAAKHDGLREPLSRAQQEASPTTQPTRSEHVSLQGQADPAQQQLASLTAEVKQPWPTHVLICVWRGLFCLHGCGCVSLHNTGWVRAADCPEQWFSGA